MQHGLPIVTPAKAGGPGNHRKTWIPAFAGMTFRRLISFVTTYQHKKNPEVDANGLPPE